MRMCAGRQNENFHDVPPWHRPRPRKGPGKRIRDKPPWATGRANGLAAQQAGQRYTVPMTRRRPTAEELAHEADAARWKARAGVRTPANGAPSAEALAEAGGQEAREAMSKLDVIASNARWEAKDAMSSDDEAVLAAMRERDRKWDGGSARPSNAGMAARDRRRLLGMLDSALFELARTGEALQRAARKRGKR